MYITWSGAILLPTATSGVWPQAVQAHIPFRSLSTLRKGKTSFPNSNSIKSRRNFETKTWILSFYVGFFFLLDQVFPNGKFFCRSFTANKVWFCCELFPWSPDPTMKPWAGPNAVWRKSYRHGSGVVECQAFQQLLHYIRMGLREIVVLVGISCDVEKPDVFLWCIIERCWNEDEGVWRRGNPRAIAWKRERETNW